MEERRICQVCRRSVPAASTECWECGSTLVLREERRVCQACRRPVPAASTECWECGSAAVPAGAGPGDDVLSTLTRYERRVEAEKRRLRQLRSLLSSHREPAGVDGEEEDEKDRAARRFEQLFPARPRAA